jgi:amidohydrolase
MWDTKTLEELKNRALPRLREEILALNDALALHPELGSREFESSRRIVALLRGHGLEVEYPFGGLETAFRARINPRAKRRAAFLAEYDALPELGHACGHCASGSASVMAALALYGIREELDAGIDLIGTPDEELLGRKAHLADAGVFNGYDFAAMVHMGPYSVVTTPFLALDGTTIKFFGVPSHAAMAPEQGRNALNAARLFFDAVDMMRQHIISEARIHGYIKRGGSASNVVPDFAEIEFLSRAPRRAQLNDITAWVYDCARAAALATRTRCEISLCGPPYHDLYISPAGEQLLKSCFTELGIETTGGQGSGSSDIGNVDYICPAFHPMMGIGQPAFCHTAEFARAMTGPGAHRAIVDSAKLLLTLVFKLYGDAATLAEVQRQHREYRGNPAAAPGERRGDL